ncbi:MAG: multiple sugar transport system permease protein [Thermomicrobiales bacterium]|jgi:multiple sugar transport system permease protein|nr:multiple sugar transport system permease protein [Thermomicrobiales bacterium]
MKEVARHPGSTVREEGREGEEAARQGTIRLPRWRRRVPGVARHAMLIGFSVAFMLPFFWMITSALKTNQGVFARPVEWIPSPAHWENFEKAINYPGFPFWRMLWNSTFYAGGVTIGTVLSCAGVGYGFARLRFPGRDTLFAITVSTLMVPAIVTFIPTYVLFKKLHLLGTYAPLIGPAFFGNAFFIFMMRQFFRGLPKELEDAARIDGAGEFRIFWEIMLPLVKPAMMVVAVFQLLYTWHELFQPLVYLSDAKQYPLSIGLYAFRSMRVAEWSLIMAASTLVTLPLIVVFLFTQRYFLQGVRMTGIKG